MTAEPIRKTKQGIEVRVHARPGASRTEFSGLHGDRLKVRVKAKPIEGEANEALVKFISKTAGVPKTQTTIVRGDKSREKNIRIVCDEPEKAIGKLKKAAGMVEGA